MAHPRIGLEIAMHPVMPLPCSKPLRKVSDVKLSRTGKGEESGTGGKYEKPGNLYVVSGGQFPTRATDAGHPN